MKEASSDGYYPLYILTDLDFIMAFFYKILAFIRKLFGIELY